MERRCLETSLPGCSFQPFGQRLRRPWIQTGSRQRSTFMQVGRIGPHGPRRKASTASCSGSRIDAAQQFAKILPLTLFLSHAAVIRLKASICFAQDLRACQWRPAVKPAGHWTATASFCSASASRLSSLCCFAGFPDQCPASSVSTCDERWGLCS